MKKYLSLFALAIVFCISSCSDDDCNHGSPTKTNQWNPIGSWYNEVGNEEIRYTGSRTYYDRYATYLRCGEIEGRWEYDDKNNKLTYDYSFMGNNIYEDWTVKNQENFSFTLSSNTAVAIQLEKIVEDYELKVGQTATIQFPTAYPDYRVVSYASNNERIASVSSDGIIKAEGEKGVTYIKVKTTKSNVWVKVTVGDNCAEMWHDYVGLIGLDYNHVSETLSSLGKPSDVSDNGYSFTYEQQLHEVVKATFVHICPECGTVDEVLLGIKESVPEVQLLAYMDSRYYKFKENDSYIYYSSVEDQDASKAIIAYNKSKKIVCFEEAQHLLHPHVKDLWTDFTPLFGSNKSQVKAKMDEYGYPFLMSMDNYSKDGSDYYSISGNNYAQMVGFVFNPDKQVSEYWVYMNSQSSPNEIFNYLNAKYTIVESEATQYTRVFYNDDQSIRVTMDLMNMAVIYTNLTMKQHEAYTEVFGNYHEGLGLTHDQIVDKFGNPYQDENNKMYYIIGTEYVDMAVFKIEAATSKCSSVILMVNANVATSKVVEYFNSRYNTFANGTAPDGSQYAWTDGSTVQESSLGIIFIPQNNMIIYQPLGSAANANSKRTTSLSISTENSLINQVKSVSSAYLNGVKKTMESLK